MAVFVEPSAEIDKHYLRFVRDYDCAVVFAPTDDRPKHRYFIPVARYGSSEESASWVVLCEVSKDDHVIRQPISKDNCFALETKENMGAYGAASFRVESWGAARSDNFEKIVIDSSVSSQVFDFVYRLNFQERSQDSPSDGSWLFEFIGRHYLNIAHESSPVCVVDAVCQICWLYREDGGYTPLYAGHRSYVLSMLADVATNHKPRDPLHVHPFHESLDGKEHGHHQLNFADAANFPVAAADALSRAHPRVTLRMETGRTRHSHPVYPNIRRHMRCIADMTRSTVYVVQYNGRDLHMTSPTHGSRLSHDIDTFLQTHTDATTSRANQVRQAMETARDELQKHVYPPGCIVLHEQRKRSRHGNTVFRIAVVKEPGVSAE